MKRKPRNEKKIACELRQLEIAIIALGIIKFHDPHSKQGKWAGNALRRIWETRND